MAILSKKNTIKVSASGHVFQKISDKIFGCRSNKVDKNKECFNNDYIFIYDNEDEYDGDDVEIGTNKNFCMVYDSDYNDNYKNRKRNRREEREIENYIDSIRSYRRS